MRDRRCGREAAEGGCQLLYRYDERCEALRNWSKPDGSPIDIRTEGGQVVVAPSIHPLGGRYEWLSSPDIQPGPMPQWLIDYFIAHGKKKPRPAPMPPREPVRRIWNHERWLIGSARNWLAKKPSSVQGDDGSTPMLTAARFLFWDMAFPEDVARQLLDEYNARAVPPWEGKELEHKIAEALNPKGAQGPYGWRRDKWLAEGRR